jgi:carbon starvation protein
MHDYGSIMMSVRNEGKSMGPISYQLASPRGRTVLLTFILFYLIIISAVFIFLIALFFKIFPGTFIATVLIFGGAFVVGQMLFKVRMNIFAVTALAIAIVIVSIAIGALVGWPPKDNPATDIDESAIFGPWTVAFFGILVMIILAIGALAPMPSFAQPAVYVAFFPAFIAVLFIVIGTLLTPIWPALGGEAITMQQPAWKGFWSGAGPLWPILFVAISCGAISGWHSLVSTSATSKQLDVETDARPVGAGAMLSEGLLGTASLAAFMVVPGLTVASSSVGGWVQGSVILTQNWLAWLGLPNIVVFFSLTLVIYALSVQILVTRFWRMVAAELFVSGIARPFGNKYVATTIGLLIPWGFAVTGSWWNLWIYFGGSNQLLAGLALMLISIHLVRSRTLSKPTLITGTFMTVTTLSALIYEAYIFFRSVTTFLATGDVGVLQTRAPLDQWPSVAFAFNLAFIFVGAVLFAVGLYMAYLVYRSYWRSYKEVTAPAPAVAANGGGEEEKE